MPASAKPRNSKPTQLREIGQILAHQGFFRTDARNSAPKRGIAGRFLFRAAKNVKDESSCILDLSITPNSLVHFSSCAGTFGSRSEFSCYGSFSRLSPVTSLRRSALK